MLFFAAVPQSHAQPLNQEDDPIKLFERGQDVHAKGDYKTAIEFYDAAIRLKPEFPEAEFQRAQALLFTNRKDEALAGFNRAVTLRPDWAFAYSKFGTFLGSYGNDPVNAEPILRRAIELNSKDVRALVVLAEIRQQAGDAAEALKLVRLATSLPDANGSTWRKRAFIESSTGVKMAALASLDRAIQIDPDGGARYDRRAATRFRKRTRYDRRAWCDRRRSTSAGAVLVERHHGPADRGDSDDAQRLPGP